MCCEEFDRFIDVHREHVTDGSSAPQNGQRFGVEPRPIADLAPDFHVGQEAHLDLLESLTFAFGTAPARGVEREAARVVATHASLGGLGKQSPDRVPETNIGSRTRAGCLADRSLIHLEDASQLLPCGDRPATEELRRFASACGSYERTQVGIEHVASERTLAAAGYAGDHRQSAQRNARLHLLQVVQVRSFDADGGGAVIGVSSLR